MWSQLDNGGFNFARSMMNTPINPANPNDAGQLTSGVGVNASIGHGNYHGAFASLKMSDWKGLTLLQNFTWSKALGTGALVQATSQYTANDPFNLDTMYGVQPFDRKFVYNAYFVYVPPFYRNQQGAIGRVLGGWTVSPIFAAGSGEPMPIYTLNGNAESFGEGDGVDFGSNENAILTQMPYSGSASLHRGVGSGLKLNIFSDPTAAFGMTRPPILGLDTRDNGYGALRGFPYWNVDLAVKKNIRLAERFALETDFVFTNVFNHFQPQDPNGYFGSANLNAASPSTFGAVPAQLNKPRQMEFGLRFSF
jgi:hypothetical protein